MEGEILLALIISANGADTSGAFCVGETQLVK